MLRSANAATPPAASTRVVPDKTPVPEWAPRATVTVAAEPVGLLNASTTETCTAGVMGRPEKVFVGLTENRSWLAGPGFAIAVKAADESADRAGSLMDAMALCCPATCPKLQLT